MQCQVDRFPQKMKLKSNINLASFAYFPQKMKLKSSINLASLAQHAVLDQSGEFRRKIREEFELNVKKFLFVFVFAVWHILGMQLLY